MSRRLNRVGGFFALLLSLSALCQAAEKGMQESQATTGYGQERYREPAAYTGPPRSGEQVYGGYCKTCHARSTQGAPLPDDDIQWRMRMRQGIDVLVEHTIDGYKELMPARGGCRNCSDAEVRAAVMYIFSSSGVLTAQRDSETR